MYMGRNDLFNIISDDEINDTYSVVIINGYECIDQNKKESELQQNLLSCYERGKMNIKELNLPLLIGEWMPMDEEGMYRLNEYIPFDSKLFRNNAVHIDHFTDWIVKLIEKENPTSQHVIYFKKNKSVSEQILEKEDEFYNNVPSESSLESILSHYEKYKNYY